MLDNSQLLNSSFKFQHFEIKNYLEMTTSEKLMVLDWRNNDKVRVWSYHPDIITQQQHNVFINSLEHRMKTGYWLVKEQEHNIGVFNLSRCDFEKKQAFLGTDVAPQLIGKGYGRKLMQCIEYVGFKQLGMMTLKLEVLSNNENAMALYSKCGYTRSHDSTGYITIGDTMLKIIKMQKQV